MGSSSLEYINVKGNKVNELEVENYIDAMHMNASVIKLDMSLGSNISVEV
jgi:hypothetical protein